MEGLVQSITRLIWIAKESLAISPKGGVLLGLHSRARVLKNERARKKASARTRLLWSGPCCWYHPLSVIAYKFYVGVKKFLRSRALFALIAVLAPTSRESVGQCARHTLKLKEPTLGLREHSGNFLEEFRNFLRFCWS